MGLLSFLRKNRHASGQGSLPPPPKKEVKKESWTQTDVDSLLKSDASTEKPPTQAPSPQPTPAVQTDSEPQLPPEPSEPAEQQAPMHDPVTPPTPKESRREEKTREENKEEKKQESSSEPVEDFDEELPSFDDAERPAPEDIFISKPDYIQLLGQIDILHQKLIAEQEGMDFSDGHIELLKKAVQQTMRAQQSLNAIEEKITW